MKRIWNAAQEYYNSRYRTFSSKVDLLEWQREQLELHLEWVCENSPYYRDCSHLPLSEYPMMDKSTMMANFNAINTVGLDRDELFEIALKAENNRHFNSSVMNDITVGMSSGTSGVRGLFLVSKEEQARWAGYIVGRLMPSMFRPQRIALLLRANSNLYRSVGRAHLKFQYIDLCQPLESWLLSLEDFNPTVIVGSAQALVVAAAECKGLTPELVVSGAEVLTPEDKQKLVRRFECDVKEVYQCTEGFLASTHRDGKMRWNEDLVHIEKKWLNESKTHFQPVVTDFRRKSQPVIRYLMDDVIVPSNDNEVFSGIDRIVGRCGDILQINGTTILPDLINTAVCRCVGDGVDFKISQIDFNALLINAEHSGDVIEQALRDLFAALGVRADVPIFIKHAGCSGRDFSVKHRRVVNLYVPESSREAHSAA